jgi:hypothetical protein
MDEKVFVKSEVLTDALMEAVRRNNWKSTAFSCVVIILLCQKILAEFDRNTLCGS